MKRAAAIKILALCAVMALPAMLTAASAWGAPSDPLFVLVPKKPSELKAPKEPPPTGYLEGPCGIAVDSTGNVYVSDYYHQAIDVFKSESKYSGQAAVAEDPLDGPCGLTFDGAGSLYVNNFHRNVVNIAANNSILPLPSVDTAHHLPTGVAYDGVTEYIFVNNRTYITAFQQNGAQVMNGLEPLQIGAGTLSDGYGLAVSAFPGTAGRIYVPDAATKTVKVYDPSVSKVSPVTTIHGPGKGFVSLSNSAVAVDRVTGNVYVVDNQQPIYTEEPEAAIDVFNSTGAFLGVLKYKVFDALPPGLAVDNSGGSTQGRVYVTSGNTDNAGIYAYGPGAQTNGFLPPTIGFVVKADGNGSGKVSSDVRAVDDCTAICANEVLPGSQLTLTAIPDPGSSFSGWSGAGCTGTGTCTVMVSETSSVSAEFTTMSSSADGNAPAVPSSATPSPPAPASSHQRARRHHSAKHRHKARHRHRARHHQ